MSTVTNVENTPNKSVTQYDRSKTFIGNNRYEPQTLVATVAAVTLAAGTLMGRVGASGEVTPLKSAASDGSQFPYGILAESFSVGIGDQPNVPVCVKGEVVKDKVIFDGTSSILFILFTYQSKSLLALGSAIV